MNRGAELFIFRRLIPDSEERVRELVCGLPGVLVQSAIPLHLTVFRLRRNKFTPAQREAIFHPQPETASQSLTLRVADVALMGTRSQSNPFLALELQDPRGIHAAERQAYHTRANAALGRSNRPPDRTPPHVSTLRVPRDSVDLLTELRGRLAADELTFGPTESYPACSTAPPRVAALHPARALVARVTDRPHPEGFLATLRRN